MPERERIPLQRLFTRVHDRYDLANRIMTLGLDGGWRRAALHEALASSPRRVLDLCCGTGDMTLLLAQAPGDRTVTGADFTAAMLEGARRKLSLRGAAAGLIQSDAARLPFHDAAFDAVTIGFGLRNLTWCNPARLTHLAELVRVIAPGGRLVVVETSQPSSLLFRMMTHAYLGFAAGLVVSLVGGDGPAYRYLARSARGFFAPGEVSRMLEAAGFASVRHRPLCCGAAAIHVALR